MTTKIFVNLHVNDLNKSIEFFKGMGYSFDPRFTDEKATCMIISDNIYSMLLTEPFFKSFTKKETCNTDECNEVLLTLSCETREEVDRRVDLALSLGGSLSGETQDHGWMYSRSFKDLDGHNWDYLYMDMEGFEKMMQSATHS